MPERGIVSVQDMAWSGIKNGQLLKLVAADFDVFITSDKNLRYQQNLSAIDLAIILLASNQVLVIRGMLDQIDKALSLIQPNSFVEL